MAHHRYIPVGIDVTILDPAPAGPGRKGGEPDDAQDVIEDLIRAVKNLKPRNKQGKSYQVHEVTKRTK